MKIDKQQVIEFLRDRGERQKAKDADRELPQKVDPTNEEDANLLQKLGVDPTALVKSFLGGKGIPGL
jgi:hypothetical protein